MQAEKQSSCSQLTSIDLLDRRVRVTRGAWRGECGKVIEQYQDRDVFVLRLDSGLRVAFFRSEIEAV